MLSPYLGKLNLEWLFQARSGSCSNRTEQNFLIVDTSMIFALSVDTLKFLSWLFGLCLRPKDEKEMSVPGFLNDFACH